MTGAGLPEKCCSRGVNDDTIVRNCFSLVSLTVSCQVCSADCAHGNSVDALQPDESSAGLATVRPFTFLTAGVGVRDLVVLYRFSWFSLMGNVTCCIDLSSDCSRSICFCFETGLIASSSWLFYLTSLVLAVLVSQEIVMHDVYSAVLCKCCTLTT